MPTRNINLTTELDQSVDDRIASGQYANASEVLRAGLRALAEDEREETAKLEVLRAAIREGEESGIAPDGVFERIMANLRSRSDARVA